VVDGKSSRAFGRMSRRPVHVALLALAITGGVACEARSPVGCTASFEPGIIVSISDSATGAPLAEAASGWVTEGTYQDSLRPFGYQGTPPAMVSRAAVHERPGRYTVQVGAPGHVDWRLQNVRVEPGECHVRTVHLEARLQRSP
jgi:hypothetical protein